MAFELRHTDKIATALLLALSALVFVLTADFPSGPGVTTPAFYPRFVAAMIALFALVQLGQSLRRGTASTHAITWERTKPVVVMTGLVVAYVGLMPLLGFLIATVLFLLVAMHYSGVERYRTSVPVAVGVAIALHYVFVEFLRVPLPRNPFLPISRLLPSLWAVPVPGVTG